MRRKYSVIAIVYNPNSTGKSKLKATQLAKDLRAAMPGAKIRLRATKRQGHGEQIAYRTGLLSRHALIISVSGDGGYNDIINGAMRASRMGKAISVGLIPAGNANDHYAARHHGNFVNRVTTGDEDVIELLRLKTKRLDRYGHSYIGLGVTPQAGAKLNASKLNPWQELKIIASVLWHIKSVRIIVQGETRHYSSVIFSNVGRMSKVIRVRDHTNLDDGKMEISYVYFRNKYKLAMALLQAATFGLDTNERASKYAFETLRQTAVQIDGEIVKLPPSTHVTISVRPNALHCIV